MAWAETDPGHWKRPIGANEAMIKMIGDNGHRFGKDVWSISATATFTLHREQAARVAPLTEILRAGWKILRFHHPSIASTAAGDIIGYHVPDQIELDRWADESFVLVKDCSSPDDVIAGLRPTRFATLYCLTDGTEEGHVTTVLNLSHWRTDGIGAFHLLNAYFQAILESVHSNPNKLPWGDEVSRLVPSAEEALKLPEKPSPEIEQAAKRYLGTLAHVSGALGTQYKEGDVISPAGTRSTRLRISRDQTAQLKKACSKLSLRLEAAAHASVAATAYCIAAPTTTQKHYTSTLRHSLRPHLLPPYDGIRGAAGLYTAGYMVKVPASQSWLENAHQYDSEYGAGATPDLLCSRRQYATLMKDILKNLPSVSPPPSGLDMSWVPDVEELIQPVHRSALGVLNVIDVGTGVNVISRHMYVFMWVFDGQLEFKLVYNEAFYSDSYVARILPLVKTNLISNLLSEGSE